MRNEKQEGIVENISDSKNKTANKRNIDVQEINYQLER